MCSFRFAWIAAALGHLLPSLAYAQPSPPAEEAAADEAAGVDEPAREAGATPEPSGADAADASAAPAEALSAEDEAAIAEALAADAATAEESAAASASPAPMSGAAPFATMPASTAMGTQSMNPDLSFIADFAFAHFSDEDANLQTGAHDPTKNGFNLQQLELSVGAAVDPYFRFDANIVFSQFGVEIEEAYATTLSLPERLQVRAGQFLTRFGRINPTHPHAWSFVDQPFSMGRVFGAEGNRGLGTELSWLSPLPWYVELVASATDAAGEATARSFYGPNDLGVKSPLDFQYTFAIKQFFPLSDDWSLAWGLSNATGPNGTGRDNRTEVYGTDLYLKWRPITEQSSQMLALQTEWLYRRRQVPSSVLQDVSGYASLVYRFWLRWAVGARFEYGSAASGAGYPDVVDYLDPEWVEERTRTSVNLTFWPTEFSRLRLQASMDRPEWLEEPVWATFLAFEVVTGAHGAHAF